MSKSFNSAGKKNIKGVVKSSNTRPASAIVHLSQKYLESTSSKVIFDSGSVIDFSLAKVKIQQEFEKENCFDLITVNEAIVLAPPVNGVFNPIPPETLFNDPEPVFDANGFTVDRTNAAIQKRDQDLQDLNTFNNQQMNVAKRNEKIFEIGRTFTEANQRIPMEVLQATQNYRNHLSMWKQDKKEHERKVSSALKVFDRCFGPGPRSLVMDDLRFHRFRRAWVSICRHYSAAHGGRAIANTITNTLMNLGYEKVGHYENLSTHFNYMYKLASDYQIATGVPIPAEQQLKYLEDSLLRCSEARRDFRLIFDHMKFNDQLTMADFIGLLQKEVSQIEIREQSKEIIVNQTSFNTINDENDDEGYCQVVTTANNIDRSSTNAGNKWCDHCETNTHLTENCWKTKYCKICEKVGHPTNKCKNYNKVLNAGKQNFKKNKKNMRGNNSSSSSAQSSNNVTHVDDDANATKITKSKKVAGLISNLKNACSSYFQLLLSIIVIYLLENSIHLFHKICEYFFRIINEYLDMIGIYSDYTRCLTSAMSENEKNSVYSLSLQSSYQLCFVTGHHIIREDSKNKIYDNNDILNESISNSSYVYDTSIVLNVYPEEYNDMNIPFYFIFDTGATCNMIPDSKELIMNYTPINGFVTLGSNNFKLPIVGKGTLNLLNDVIYVPGLKFGLISISYFDRMGYQIKIHSGLIRIVDRNDNVILSGYLHSCNLYFLDRLYYEIILNISSLVSHNSNTMSISCEECMNYIDVTNDESLETLHRRWGHIGTGKLRAAYKNNAVVGLKRKYEDIKNDILKTCPSCLKGSMKASRVSEGEKDNTLKWKPLEKIAIDYKGDFPIRSVHGYYGFFLLCDYNSGYVYAHMVNSKRKMIEALSTFKNGVVMFHNGNWKILQSDYDSVINSEKVKSWLLNNKIKLQLSAPYLHYQNGMVERQIQNVMDKARTLMIEYNVPPKYWEYAIVTACYYLNRTPNRNNTSTPYELVTGTKPDVSHFVPFFCPGYYHVSVEERHQLRNRSWTPKAEPCRMLGYDEKSKDCYIVLNTRTRRIVSRMNCVFDVNLSVDELNEIYDKEFEEFIQTQTKEGESNDIEKLEEINSRIIKEGIEKEPQIIVDEEPEEEFEDTSPSPPALSSENVHQLPSQMFDKKEKNDEENESDEGSTDAPSEDSNNIVLIVFIDENDKNSRGDMEIDKWYEFLHWYSDMCYTVTELSLPPTPKSTEEALKGPDKEKWIEAITKELQQMDDMNMFGEAPQEGRAMKTKLVYRVSFNNDYSVKYKARLVVCGYSQIYGLDYDLTYSPTVSSIVVMLLMNYIIANNMVYGSFDIKGAFLEGKPDKKLFCRLPSELSGGHGKLGERVEILRNIYGEKQAPKVWNDYFNKILIEMGFKRCPADPCLYSWIDKNNTIIIGVHVDDGLIASNDMKLIESFIEKLKRYLEVNYFYPMNKFIGMDIVYEKELNKIILSQSLYINDKIKKLMNNSDLDNIPKDINKIIPMAPTTNLRTAIPNEKNDSLLNITGSLRYIADKTRHDILASTGEISCGGAKNPSDEHVKVANQILKYIFHTKDANLVLGGNDSIELFGFCDAAYVTTGDSRSRLGGCLFLGRDTGAFHSFSKLANTVCHSSTEAEIKALDELARTIVWIRDILEFLNCPMTSPTRIYMDNKSAIQLCEIFKINHKVRHINIRINYIRELINNKVIELHFIASNFNVADVLTKPLASESFHQHSNILLYGFKANNLERILSNHHTHLVFNVVDNTYEIRRVC